MEVGPVSLLEDVVQCAYVFVPRSLRFLLTFVASGFPVRWKIGTAASHPEQRTLAIHGTERTRTFRVLLELRRLP